ncbi:MAG: hypothetical protein IJX37_02160 [Oscillospiraceae bacterium]|nr:hypothetical protein [Oscillospiraceae bacterium]
MIIAKIEVSGTSAKTIFTKDIPAGIIGAQVEIEYTDAMWSGLSKTVVFRGCCTKDITNAGTSVIIPAEVVANSGVSIMIGVYGVDADNNLAIPTLWATLGMTKSAANPVGDATTDPALPVWAQLDGRVSDLEKNQVAVDKTLEVSGNAADAAAVGAALKARVKTVNGAAPDENGNVTVEIPKQVQPDWSQNNSAKPDYVKNRTHYSEMVEEVMVSVEIPRIPLGIRQIPYENLCFNGEMLRVVFNGVTYDLEATDYNDDIGWLYGDIVCTGDTGCDLTSNGELPFGVAYNGYNFMVVVRDTTNPVTIAISHFVESVHKLDKKYIPDSVKAQSDWSQNDLSQPDYVKNRTHYEEITEESIEGRVYDIPTYLQHDSAYVHNLHIPLQLGQAWTIEPAESYLGNTETCEVEQADDGTPCLRWKNDLVTLTADSIVVGAWGDSQYLTGLKITCVSGTVTTKIVKTIDPKYIKDMYYAEVVEESIEGLEYADIPASVTVAQHNLNIPLQAGQIWDSTPNKSSAYNGLEVKQADDGTVYIGDYPKCSAVPFYITDKEIKCSQSWVNMIGVSSVDIVCVSGTVKTTTVHKLDAKYLPYFDFDISVISAGQYAFADIAQVQEALDKNMMLKVVYSTTTSGTTASLVTTLPCIKDCMVINEASGTVIGIQYESLSKQFQLKTYLDADDYANGVITATSTQLIANSTYTLVKVYAAPF